MAEEPGDWLHNLVNDGIFAAWEQKEKDEPSWEQLDDHRGGWFDIDFADKNPGEIAGELIDKLEGCTAEQLNTMAQILFIAIKSTRIICGEW